MIRFATALLFLMLALIPACAHNEKLANEASFYTKLGISNLVTQNYTEALRYLLEAEKREPNNAELQNALGLAYYYKGEYQLATDAYRKAVEIKPDFSEAWNNLGAVYATMGKFDDAIAAFDSSLKNLLYDTPEKAWLNKADAYAARLDSKSALEGYEKALTLAMPKPQARDVVCVTYNNMGRVYARDKRYTEAVRVLNQAVKLCSKYADPYFQLSFVYSRLQKNPDAIKACDKVISLMPDSPAAQSCERFNDILRGKGR